MPIFASMVPVLRVSDVARSLAWYRDNLGFEADPMPANAPHEYCLLRRDRTELLLRRAHAPIARTADAYDWDVCIRLEGGELIALLDHARRRTPLVRGPEIMPAGHVEFELEDPDRHRVCVAERLTDTTGIPPAV
ncbi:MAG: hypothetical protein ACK6DP_03410 [Gemmatimonas sp.]|jgi:catechol 2,3-dioxygenase-like lactoylglutathione lyase family enzyme|uniref:hypothetical protein n=1 Tax=Gemmatimonas sp. TaxID=1962908 RepID=UPI00391F3C70|nr:hypothetical protein [Gemmatimonadota bacterium]